jgi:hypothetical protein
MTILFELLPDDSGRFARSGSKRPVSTPNVARPLHGRDKRCQLKEQERADYVRLILTVFGRLCVTCD